MNMAERLPGGVTKDAAETSHGCGCSEPRSESWSVRESLPEMDFRRSLAGAAQSGDIQRMEELLRRGADVNGEDDAGAGGYAPLHYAARQGHVDACRLLLKYRADVDRQTRAGKSTSLQRAAYAGHEGVVVLLLQNRADPLVADGDGHTALSKAEIQGHQKIVNILKSSIGNQKQPPSGEPGFQ